MNNKETNMQDIEIINNLKNNISDTGIYIQEATSGYKQKDLEFKYLTKNSLLEKKYKENDSTRRNSFGYRTSDEKINELMKKFSTWELFDFLVSRHLEKYKGCGEKPKQFKAPCPYCNQKALTTISGNENNYPENLEKFYCRLCNNTFDSGVDIKDDPIELQREMVEYYVIFKQREIESDDRLLKKNQKSINEIKERLANNQKLLLELKNYVNRF